MTSDRTFPGFIAGAGLIVLALILYLDWREGRL